MPWNLVVRWGIGTKWQSLIQAVEAALRTMGWRRRRSRFSSPQRFLLSLSHAAELSSSFGWVEQSFTERDWAHLELQPWGQTRRQPSSQPTPQTHTETHTHTYVLKCWSVMALNSLFLTCHLCKQEAKQYLMYIFISLMRRAIFIRFNKAGKELFYFKKKKSFELKCSLKAS